jgi:serine/threonine protein kinase
LFLNRPRRTRTSSGSIVRIFRGEFIGTVGGSLSAQGFDRRVLVKEFTDTELALSLVRSELQSLGRLQSNLVFGNEKNSEDALRNGAQWIRAASARSSVDLRKDTANVVTLMKALAVAPFVGILGEVSLAELDGNLEPNEFYRALGVPPPKPGSVWLVYEYAGLATVQAYSEPAELRLAKLPPKKGFFGNVIEASPPSWKDRANYVVKGIMKNTILAIASIHENGMVHGSIGRSSIILSSKEMDKRNAISPMNTMISILRVKLSEFAFAKTFEESTSNEEFCTRARTFGLSFQKGDHNVLTTNFAIAEDMHAVGFVFLGLLLTTLAELPRPVTSTYQMPATDDDTLQRLLSDIFDKDMNQFREFVLEEDIWSNLVALLDDNDQSGWKVLETLVLARENAAKRKDTDQLFTIRGLLSTPFFQ